ncbi:hypothetical protein EM4838_08350 [Enterococcus mundtii]|uniref:DUF1642 domain-containing protein n=2 Tax=Enterococcus mundtii TaxID=53346 RepID=A0ABQ0VC95_ENTMU|nr:DUF1642 domain-containing protein [Enterococcus mundtii]AUB53004.1 hypothetical protein EM4838_08350 [Enterococcus mundtii]GEL80074.1 hypothetical protein EMU01_12180 [Enterococcus mundtii]GEN18146.1 hypothetical protein LAC02_14270 [Ligilactobacillus acidipiscis]
MNKRDLIGKWENKKGAPSYEISAFPVNPSLNEMYIAGYGVAKTEILEDLKQLDEPQKPVVPEFVAEWFEEHKDDLEFPIWELCADSYNAEDEQGMLDWIQCSENKPIETLIRMKDGYEVEKEPLYMVPLLTDKEGNKKILVERRGQYDIIWDYENEDDWHELLTEEQIKSVNPDYWKFAVLYEPSEEVA